MALGISDPNALTHAKRRRTEHTQAGTRTTGVDFCWKCKIAWIFTYFIVFLPLPPLGSSLRFHRRFSFCFAYLGWWNYSVTLLQPILVVSMTAFSIEFHHRWDIWLRESSDPRPRLSIWAILYNGSTAGARARTSTTKVNANSIPAPVSMSVIKRKISWVEMALWLYCYAVIAEEAKKLITTVHRK